MNDIYLVLWVTSRCNLHCPKCNQKPAMDENSTYDLPWEEFQEFVDSSLRRGIHYAAIECSGGEPTMWLHFAEGLKLLHDSNIADWVTFVSNGNNAAAVAAVANKYAPFYGISATQATKEQLLAHISVNNNIFLNQFPHRDVPKEPLPNTHPAVCVVENARNGQRVLPLAYYNKRIYHCCTARSLGGSHLSVPFDSDFVTHFRTQPRDQAICGRCLCNSKVWQQVDADA